MAEKIIDDIIEQFSKESNFNRDLINKIEAAISKGKVPPKTESDALIEGLNRLNSIYRSAYTYTKQHVMENELPADGSPIFAMKKAIETSELTALKKKIDSKKIIISQFIKVNSAIEQYSSTLAPFQKKAAALLDKLNHYDTLSASKLLNEAELPELFINAMNADPATEDGIMTISKAGENFGPIVLVGLSSKQYSISEKAIIPAAISENKQPATVQKEDSNEKPVKPVATINTKDDIVQKEDGYDIADTLLRNAFMNQSESNVSPDVFDHSSSKNSLFKKYESLQSLYNALTDFNKAAHCGLDKYADHHNKEYASLEKEIDKCIENAKDLYHQYVEEPLKEQNAPQLYLATSDMILKKSVLSDCLEIVKDNDIVNMHFIDTSLHEYFIDKDLPIEFTNISSDSIDRIINEAWRSSDDDTKGRKKSPKLPDPLRRRLRKKIEDCLSVICKWTSLINKNIKQDDIPKFSAYLKCRPDILKCTDELQKQLSTDIDNAKKAEKPDVSKIAGLNLLLSTVKEISQKVNG